MQASSSPPITRPCHGKTGFQPRSAKKETPRVYGVESLERETGLEPATFSLGS